MNVRWLIAIASLAMAATAACSGDDGRETVTVYAASSLTDAFTELGQAFSEAHPEYEVEYNFASSSELAVQINAGAPADVFASANQDQMDVVLEAGNAARRTVLTANELALGVPADSDVVQEFDDLAAPGTIVVVAAPDVPVGALTRAALDAVLLSPAYDTDFLNAVLENIASEEPSVRAVLAKLELGEADAGFVYATDLAVADETVRRVEIPKQGRLSNLYFIAALNGGGEGAQGFVRFALSEQGQTILAKYGFGPSAS